jgi:hypothetical protein
MEQRAELPAFGQFRLKALFIIVLIVASLLGVQRAYGLTYGETAALGAVTFYVGLIYLVHDQFFQPQWAFGLLLLFICALASPVLFLHPATPKSNVVVAGLTITVVLSGVVGGFAFLCSIFA